MTATVGNWALFTDFNYSKCVFACMYVCAHHMYLVPLRKEEGFPGTGVTEGYEPPRRCEEGTWVSAMQPALYCWALFPPPRKMSCFFLKIILLLFQIFWMFDLSKSLKLLYLSHLLQSHTLVILSLGLCCLTTVYFLGTPLSSFVSLPLKTSPEKHLQTLLVSWGPAC